MPGTPPETPTTCPRCGYDLKGIVKTWKTACPVTGTCTECGFNFEWREVLNTRFRPPRWSLEHAPVRRLPRAWIDSMLISARPWRFWRELRMEHEVRPGRLWINVLTQLTVLYVLFCLAGGLLMYLESRGGPGVWRNVRAVMLTPLSTKETLTIPTSMWFGGSPRGFYIRHFEDIAWLIVGHFAFTISYAIAFSLIPDRQCNAQDASLHAIRIWVYHVRWTVPVGAVLLMLRAMGAEQSSIVIWAAALLTLFSLTWWRYALGAYSGFIHAWVMSVGLLSLACAGTILIGLFIGFVMPAGSDPLRLVCPSTSSAYDTAMTTSTTTNTHSAAPVDALADGLIPRSWLLSICTSSTFPRTAGSALSSSHAGGNSRHANDLSALRV